MGEEPTDETDEAAKTMSDGSPGPSRGARQPVENQFEPELEGIAARVVGAQHGR